MVIRITPFMDNSGIPDTNFFKGDRYNRLPGIYDTGMHIQTMRNPLREIIELLRCIFKIIF